MAALVSGWSAVVWADPIIEHSESETLHSRGIQ